MQSVEFAGLRGPIIRLYFATFLRVPDYAGLSFWINEYRGGRSLPSIAEAFATAQEFTNTYGTLNNRAYVRQLYLNVLGREPDPAGWDSWTGYLDRGEITRGALLVGFSESQEFQNRIRNKERVTEAYFGMLRREPDPAGFADNVAALDAGVSLAGLLNSFLNTGEYRARFLP